MWRECASESAGEQFSDYKYKEKQKVYNNDNERKKKDTAKQTWHDYNIIMVYYI